VLYFLCLLYRLNLLNFIFEFPDKLSGNILPQIMDSKLLKNHGLHFKIVLNELQDVLLQVGFVQVVLYQEKLLC
jgi:hypothetical protein